MFVKFNIGYDHAIAQVSANELDAFVKVVSAMQMVEYDYSVKSVFVRKNEKVRVGIEILPHQIKMIEKPEVTE